MGDAAKMHANFESWREQAVRKWKWFKKNKRTKQAAAYWEGYAQACANAKCIAYGYMRMEQAFDAVEKK